MTAFEPDRRRSFALTPAWLIYSLLVMECLLWLSERFQWFGFNEHLGPNFLATKDRTGRKEMHFLCGLCVPSRLTHCLADASG